jgi:ATP-dependent DNA ligase
VRLYSRNAYDWTARLTAIAAAAERIKAESFACRKGGCQR